MKDINFRRKVNVRFNAFGTRFLAGDIIEVNKKTIIHYYINENKDGIDKLEHNKNQLNGAVIETILDNSQDI